HFHDVVFLQYDIPAAITAQQVIVHIHLLFQLTLAEYLHVAQTPDIIDPSCRIQCMKDRGKGAECVGARQYHFPHDVDLDAANVPDGSLDEGARVSGAQIRIDPAEGRFDLGRGFLNVHSL